MKDYSKKSIRELDKILWRWFSQYIRLRDANRSGLARCISCGKMMWVWQYTDKLHFNQQCHAGHYHSKGASNKVLKYNEQNVNAQCCHCNTYNEGSKDGYRRGLIEKYGKGILDELLIKNQSISKWSRFEYEILIKNYKDQVKQMLKELK